MNKHHWNRITIDARIEATIKHFAVVSPVVPATPVAMPDHARAFRAETRQTMRNRGSFRPSVKRSVDRTFEHRIEELLRGQAEGLKLREKIAVLKAENKATRLALREKIAARQAVKLAASQDAAALASMARVKAARKAAQ